MTSRLAVHGSIFIDDSTEIVARHVGPNGQGHVSLVGDHDALGIHLGSTPDERRRTVERLVAALIAARDDRPAEREEFESWRDKRALEPRCQSPICGLGIGHAVGAVGCRYGAEVPHG